MNLIKNMEAAFLFSLGAVALVSVAVEAIPPAQARVPVQVASQVKAPAIPVVVVSAKRMTAAEKQQSLAMERAQQGR